MPANYVLLETIELSQSAASVTFDNLPTSGYTDLKVVVSARTSDANTGTIAYVKFNGSSSTYSSRFLQGRGDVIASGTGSTSYGEIGRIPGINSPATDNVFSNTEIIIPNYLSSNNKSYSADEVTEANQTIAYAILTAGLWSTSSAITSILIASTAGNLVANSTFSLYGIAALGTTPIVAPFATGGNIVAQDGTYWYHAFLSSGTFTPAKTLSCDYLVIAGGGAGGWGSGAIGAGGGAGGLRAITATTLLANTNYATTVGGGGAGRGTAGSGTNGSNSVFNSITSTGGGGGGGGSASGVGLQGNSGGSGGGSNGWDFVGTRVGGLGNTPSTSPSQGNDGGLHTGNGSNRSGGGGGGAGGAGGASNVGSGGTGGAGLNTITGYGSFSATATATNTGVSGYYAGGGGGAGDSPTSDRAGGSGGGGAGGYFSPSTKNGVASTGSGGGGVGDGTGGQSSGNGASGIVIIRYPMSS